MTLGRSLLWFVIGVVWVCTAFAIVYGHSGQIEQLAIEGLTTMTHNDEGQLTERMNSLAAELAGLSPNDPRRAEIINEITRLSLVSASLKRRTADG